MNAEHPARLLALPATMLLLVLHVPSARADRAEKAFVKVRAVGAGVTSLLFFVTLKKIHAIEGEPRDGKAEE